MFLPEEFIPLLDKLEGGETIIDKVKIALAVSLFTKKVVTLERAAELAGESLVDFMDILKIHGIPWGEYTEEDKAHDEYILKKNVEGIKAVSPKNVAAAFSWRQIYALFRRNFSIKW
ncbi:MAG: UPF0175 family protein [Firmicutes bacterium]|nr:UPF0175 family protein [Bacillota bacterium]